MMSREILAARHQERYEPPVDWRIRRRQVVTQGLRSTVSMETEAHDVRCMLSNSGHPEKSSPQRSLIAQVDLVTRTISGRLEAHTDIMQAAV